MSSRIVTAAVVTFAVSAAFASPKITSTSVKASQDGASRTVTVEYQLSGEPAIVTIDIQTNFVVSGEKQWASIGGDKLVGFWGDVNILNLNTTTPSKAYWHPDKCWPDGGMLKGVRAVVTAWATNAPPDYIVVDLTKEKGRNLSFYARKEEIPLGVTNDIYKTDKLVMRRIPAKGVTWRMGNPGSTNYQYPDHLVAFTYDYYLGVYELTQKQFSHVGGTNISQFRGNTLPVEQVSWNESRGILASYPNTEHAVDPAKACGGLRTKSGIDFDLPSTEEWEYACRAGTGTTYYNGDDAAELGRIAWYADNSGNETHPVGLREPNAWGLYDMLGNVAEWTRSGYSTIKKAATDCKNVPVVDPDTTLPTDADNSMWYRGGHFRSSKDKPERISSYGTSYGKVAMWNYYSSNILIGVRMRAPAVITY